MMKAFNTFTTNSPVHSQFQSPKQPSAAFMFTSEADSRNQEHQKTAHFIRDTIKKIPSAEIVKDVAENEKDESIEDLHSEVSLLLSQVSVPAAQRPQYNAERLFSLQNNISKHILELREQKISLMQELSQFIDTKNLFEHYLLKKQKEDDRQTEYDSRIVPETPRSPQEQIVPTHISALILKRNEELHRKLKELEVREEIFGSGYRQLEAEDPESKRITEQIMQIREMTNNLQKEMSNKLKNSKDSRFVTFHPQDKAKHQELLHTHEQVDKLKNKYNELMARDKDPVFKLTEQEMSYVDELRQENQQLLRQVEIMLRRKADSNIGELRQRLDQNQREKSVFLGELQKFKRNMKALKEQNNRLKQQLGY